MEFRILGPLVVHGDDCRPCELGAGRERSLLAVLILRANEVVPRDRLIEDLWGASPPRTAAKALQGHVSQLRKTLHCRGSGGDVILTQAPGYVLRIDPQALDSFRFERLLGDGRRARVAGAPEEAATILREALGLWRGPPLAEFGFEEFAQREIARLGELRLTCLEERVEAELELGFDTELVGELEALVRDHPLRERFRGQLMLALYRSGRQAEALQQYQHARRALVEELGLVPGKELQRCPTGRAAASSASTGRTSPSSSARLSRMAACESQIPRRCGFEGSPRRARRSTSFASAGTLNGNPVAAAAGLATLDILDEPGAHERLFDAGDRLIRCGCADPAATSRSPVALPRSTTLSSRRSR